MNTSVSLAVSRKNTRLSNTSLDLQSIGTFAPTKVWIVALVYTYFIAFWIWLKTSFKILQVPLLMYKLIYNSYVKNIVVDVFNMFRSIYLYYITKRRKKNSWKSTVTFLKCGTLNLNKESNIRFKFLFKLHCSFHWGPR